MPNLLSSCVRGVPEALASINTISGSQYWYSSYATLFNSGKSQRSFWASNNIILSGESGVGLNTPHVDIAE